MSREKIIRQCVDRLNLPGDWLLDRLWAYPGIPGSAENNPIALLIRAETGVRVQVCTHFLDFVDLPGDDGRRREIRVNLPVGVVEFLRRFHGRQIEPLIVPAAKRRMKQAS